MYTGAKVQWNVFSILHSPFPFFLVIAITIFLSGCSDPSHSPTDTFTHSPTKPPTQSPAKIISLAPSITEVLYALGLDDHIAGVTRFCDYPPRAAEKPVVGGYFDVNYEMLLTLEPDLVILLKEHQDALHRLEELGIPTLSVDHSRVNGILESITLIAEHCGVEERGRNLRGSLESRIKKIQEEFSPPHPLNSSPPRVLVAVGRLMEKGSTGEIFVSGRDGFYDDLITLAGGTNAYGAETLKFPAISEEGLVRLDPDIVFEMVPDISDERERQSLMELWRSKGEVRAVKEGNVHILGEDYVVVPGPRFVDLLEEMAEIINGFQIPDSRFQK